MRRVGVSEVPDQCALRPLLRGADFHDAYRFPVADPGLPALGVFMAVMAGCPPWVERLMWARNRIARAAGLKDLGAIGAVDPAVPAGAYRPGDRVGIFTVVDNRPEEAVLGDRDSHLDVWLSVCRLPPGDGGHWAAVTTVVRTKNGLGRLYMRAVGPLHGLIVPASLRAYVARFAS